MKVFGPIGKGETLLFVHGALSDGQMWRAHKHLAGKYYRCLSFTQRYFFDAPNTINITQNTTNLTENPTDLTQNTIDSCSKTFGVSGHAEDLVTLIETLNAKTLHLIGWSYGADVCMATAGLIPERIASVFAYEPGHSLYLKNSPQKMAYWQDTQQAFASVFQASQAQDWPLAAKRLVNASAEEDNYFDHQPQSVQEMQFRNLCSLPLQLQQSCWEDAYSLKALGAWKNPKITLAFGEHSRTLFQLATQAASELIPNSQLLKLPNATHMLPLEDPETFMSAVLSKLATNTFSKNPLKAQHTNNEYQNSIVPTPIECL